MNIKFLFYGTFCLFLFMFEALNGEMTFGSKSETNSDSVRDYFLTKCKIKKNDTNSEPYDHRQCFENNKSYSLDCQYLTEGHKNLYVNLTNMMNGNQKDKIPMTLENGLKNDKNNDKNQHSIICGDLLDKIVQEKYSDELFENIYQICKEFIEQDSSDYVLVASRYGRVDILKKIKSLGAGISVAAKYAMQECQKDVYFYSINDYAEDFSKTRWGYYLSDINSFPEIYLNVTLPSDNIERIKPFIENDVFKTNLGINMDFPSDNTHGLKKDLIKQKDLIVTPLFSALSGIISGYGKVFKGNSLPVIKYLISQGAKINSDTMKGFSPYSLVKSSARSEKEKQEIIQYLKNELNVPDDGKIFNFDDWKCKFIHHTPCF